MGMYRIWTLPTPSYSQDSLWKACSQYSGSITECDNNKNIGCGYLTFGAENCNLCVPRNIPNFVSTQENCQKIREKIDEVNANNNITAIIPTPDGNINKIYGNILQKKSFPIYSSPIIPGKPLGEEFQIGYSGSQAYTNNTCSGDSGGPLFYKYKNNLYLLGVLSRGNTYMPSTFTTVMAYNEWINSIITKTIIPTPAFNPAPNECYDGEKCKNNFKCVYGICWPNSYLRIFLTPDIYERNPNGWLPANLGGLSAADRICQNKAKKAGLIGSFKAFLSDSKTHIRDRIKKKNLPYYTLDGYIVARSFTDFEKGNLLSPITVYENGKRNVESTYTDVLTGLKKDFTQLPSNQNCNDWKSSEGTGYAGDAYTLSSWIYEPTFKIPCSYNSYALYCIEDYP